MIAFLSGKLLGKQPTRLIVDVNGVGYDVTVPFSTFYEIGEVGDLIQLLIYTHVREDALALFGFKTLKEKQMFEQLTSVSGIGPKLGIGILSGMSVDELVPAIRQGDVPRLTAIPGVGKKTAERLVLELRDKVTKIAPVTPDTGSSVRTITAHEEDVLSALVNLGYAKPHAEKALHKALSLLGDHQPFEILLKTALQHLSR